MRNAVAATLIAAGCGTDAPAPEEPLTRTDLRAAFGTADVTPVGLAIGADGSRFVFDESLGLYRLDAAIGAATEVVSMAAMPSPGPTAPIRLPFTDLISMAPNVFALTAIGDGYLLDTQAMTLTQHFCYLPGEEGGTPVSIQQRTDAIAYDAERDRLYAQPITTDLAGTFLRSEMAVYDATTGDDLAWQDVGNLAATGMIVLDGRIYVGHGARLSLFETGAGVLEREDLSRFGVRSIDGIAVDPVSRALVIVDKVTDAVFDLDPAVLAL